MECYQSTRLSLTKKVERKQLKLESSTMWALHTPCGIMVGTSAIYYKSISGPSKGRNYRPIIFRCIIMAASASAIAVSFLAVSFNRSM